jgi:hypothetical protein
MTANVWGIAKPAEKYPVMSRPMQGAVILACPVNPALLQIVGGDKLIIPFC